MDFTNELNFLHNILINYVKEMNTLYVAEEISFRIETDGFTSFVFMEFEGGKYCIFDEEMDSIEFDVDDDTMEKEEYSIAYYLNFKDKMQLNIKEFVKKTRTIYTILKQ